MNHDDLVAKILQNPETRESYSRMEPEFKQLREILYRQKINSSTRSEVAESVCTDQEKEKLADGLLDDGDCDVSNEIDS